MTTLRTLSIDFKSLLIGFLVCGMIFTSLAFDSPDGNQENGRYTVAAGEEGFVILDTQTGNYILDQDAVVIGSYRWIKGDFASSYEFGLDKTSKERKN